MMKISDAAKRAGVLATTIRYYESIGLLPPAHRINGHRVYGPEILDRLAVIRFGLNTGFSLAQLKALFLGIESRTKRRSIAQGKLKELRNLRDRVGLMEKLLKEIRLCRCGTIQQIAERLMQSGALAGATRGRAGTFTVRPRTTPIGIVDKYR
jgi:MerR family transcriptional regulator, redox-sensitive transcriptional activator SoxR